MREPTDLLFLSVGKLSATAHSYSKACGSDLFISGDIASVQRSANLHWNPASRTAVGSWTLTALWQEIMHVKENFPAGHLIGSEQRESLSRKSQKRVRVGWSCGLNLKVRLCGCGDIQHHLMSNCELLCLVSLVFCLESLVSLHFYPSFHWDLRNYL